MPLREEVGSSIPDPVAEDITSLHGVTLNVEKRIVPKRAGIAHPEDVARS